MNESLTDEVFQREGFDPEIFITPALKFWRSMDPALEAEAEEWKKLREWPQTPSRYQAARVRE